MTPEELQQVIAEALGIPTYYVEVEKRISSDATNMTLTRFVVWVNEH